MLSDPQSKRIIRLPVGTTAVVMPSIGQGILWPVLSDQGYAPVFGLGPRIIQTPGLLGGKPHIAGHRISVQDVVIWHERMGMDIDEIAIKYHLTPEDIRAALLYYSEHRNEIEESIRAGETFVAEMQQRYLSKLKARRDG